MAIGTQEAIQEYIDTIAKRYASGISTEHSYRGDLQNLLEILCPNVTIINEPKRQACGAPDYIVTNKNDIPIGYIEAKDVGKNLDDKQLQEQFGRYKASLENLIITDYLTFRLYLHGEAVQELAIGKIENGKIVPLPQNYEDFVNLLQNFCLYVGQSIKSPAKLAKMMATKAKLLANIIEKAILSDEASGDDSTLKDQMEAFKRILIHDITPKAFADIYAQTIAYGMFAARLHDPTLEDFSRQEAAELIPKSNPFLRSLFGYIAGPDIDERIEWIVADLADIFRATDVRALLKDFGKATGQRDAMLHFYETFLGHYDKKLKKSRGVWYTPEAVVRFIVRSVDVLLKEKFGLIEGLADTSKTIVTIKSSQGGDKRYKDGYKRIEKEMHKVQILDPATGTGTFLADVVKEIYRRFEGQEGIWSSYVAEHLIPRLNGFEILMAPYAIAHLKLDLLLGQTGYKPRKNQRLRIYLTNSLEEYHPDTGTLFASWLAKEADEANRVKRDTPVMVVLGNPPYSGHSANKGSWIEKLLNDYKQEPDGGKLKEKNPKWLNDDYVKFIRYGQYYIERNGEGILAYINPHGYLDNPTFRGMRYKLLQTFDEIYVLDLHGNANKKETAPDGGKDENVFDIKQGVSINLFVKTGQKSEGELAKVFHADLYGLREEKYAFLSTHSVKNVDYKQLSPKAPQYYFVPKDETLQAEYESGFSLDTLFPVSSVGIVTARDQFTIQDTPEKVWEIVTDFIALDVETARKKYNLRKDVRDWKVALAQEDIRQSGPNRKNIVPIDYRPFDTRYTYYTGKSKGFHCMPRGEVMRHMLAGENVGLIFSRQSTNRHWDSIAVTKHIIDNRYHYSAKGIVQQAPLYLYPDDDSLAQKRTPNLDMAIVEKIAEGLGLAFTSEKSDEPNTFAPIDLLDYIYAVLHSPSYRKKYQEFLKTDFPRVPYPTDTESFWKLVELGKRLRAIHLMQSPELSPIITRYPVEGDNTITRKIVKKDFELTDKEKGLGRVWINDTQYFEDVPQRAWEFYIGGYQPAQKWLKDRSGRTLSFEEILHYQKIIKALVLTHQIMEEIDSIFLPIEKQKEA